MLTAEINWGQVREFVSVCEGLGIEPPAAAVRGLDIIAVAEAHKMVEAPTLLDASDDQVREYLDSLALRSTSILDASGMPAMGGAIGSMSRLLASEVRAAVVADMDRFTKALRPRFDKQAKILVDAAQTYGYTLRTTSDEVIMRADEKASEAWRATRRAWFEIQRIADVRIRASKVFRCGPITDFADSGQTNAETWDYSVCFAAGGDWSMDGSKYVQGNVHGDLDWLALAAGGLRLNTPAETDAMTRERVMAQLAS